jgi:predicted TIM-barrel fold metal-dependent hydrolase
MFGTNWPMISHGKCLRDLDRLGLSSAETDDFLGGIAGRVFGI